MIPVPILDGSKPVKPTMTAREFCFWLEGFLESAVDDEAIKAIRERLNPILAREEPPPVTVPVYTPITPWWTPHTTYDVGGTAAPPDLKPMVTC